MKNNKNPLAYYFLLNMRWSSCITRRWKCPPDCRGKTAALRKDLEKKELALDQKEKELLKKERLLQLEIKKYKKVKHNNRKVKADLKAADKLNRARKRLLLVLDSQDRLKKSKRKHKVASRIKKRGDGKHKKKGNKGFINAITGYPVQCLTDLLNKPCNCNPGRVRRSGEIEPSFLRRIFGGPCDCVCAPSQGRKYIDNYRKMIGLHMCRCESPRNRNRNDGAGDCYLMSLRQTPQVWIHHRWPRLYPHYLDARHQWKNFSYCMMLCAGIILWTPCIICLELCKCFCCTCCSD